MTYIHQEISEERSKQLELGESRFEALFANSKQSIQILSLDGRTTRVNAAWKSLWNISDDFAENYIIKEYNILTDPVLAAKGILPHLERAWAGEFLELPSIFYDPAENGKEGRKRITRPLACPVKNRKGELQEIILIHQDITEQHEEVENRNFLTEVAATMLESLDYAKTLNHIAETSVPFFADGCQIDMLEKGGIKRLVVKNRDPRIEEIFRNLQNRFPSYLDSPLPSSRVICSGEALLLTNIDQEVLAQHTYDQEHAAILKDIGIKSLIAIPLIIRGETIGSVLFLINSQRRPFCPKDLGLAVEIGRYASLAIDNAALYRNVQLAVSQREDFISIASHELKTPVTALMLQMEIIQTILKDEGPTDLKTLNRISAGASRQLERLTNLINDMLDLTRLTRRKLITELKTDVDIKLLVEQVISRFSEELDSKSILTSLHSDESMLVKCDPGRTEQVVTNLMSNAILYGRQRPIEISLTKVDNRAICRFKDYGIGIHPSDHQRIFERFERGVAATDGKGLGLGLFISQQIMMAQGGSIHVESELNKGSTFTFELPLS